MKQLSFDARAGLCVKHDKRTSSKRATVKTSLALLLLVLFLAACSGTQEPPDEMLPPPPTRQSELTRLYDRLGHEQAGIGEGAAKTAADGDDRDRRFMASLWGTRTRSALGARRFATALAAKALHQDALDWFERGFHAVEGDDELLAWLRYEMAVEYVALGRNQDAINLLGNRLGTTPLPTELKRKYDELIQRASVSRG